MLFRRARKNSKLLRNDSFVASLGVPITRAERKILTTGRFCDCMTAGYKRSIDATPRRRADVGFKLYVGLHTRLDEFSHNQVDFSYNTSIFPLHIFHRNLPNNISLSPYIIR